MNTRCSTQCNIAQNTEIDEAVIPPDEDISQEDSSSSSDQEVLSVQVNDYTKGCDRLLAKAMISSCNPMVICDNAEFVEFCKKLNRLYRPPSRQYLSKLCPTNF